MNNKHKMIGLVIMCWIFAIVALLVFVKLAPELHNVTNNINFSGNITDTMTKLKP